MDDLKDTLKQIFINEFGMKESENPNIDLENPVTDEKYVIEFD